MGVKVEGKSDKKKEAATPKLPPSEILVIGSVVLILMIVFGVVAMQLIRNRERHMLSGDMVNTVKSENFEWRQHVDAVSGSPYWVNSVSGESTWENPFRQSTTNSSTPTMQTNAYWGMHQQVPYSLDQNAAMARSTWY